MNPTEEKTSIFVTATEADTRIDRILAGRFLDIHSRSYFQTLLREGFVLLNGRRVKKQIRPEEGDEITIHFVLTKELDLTPEDIPLDILFEDEHLLAINKKVGMVAHPAPGNWSGTFVNALLYHCKIEQADESLRPGIVHRLDKETSGVLIAAKTRRAQQVLIEAFSHRKVKKTYLAICLGNPGSGEINASIGRHPIKRKEMTVREEGGRSALTIYTTLESQGGLSLVQLIPHTGRTHQLRVHMKHHRTPILGDSVYGNAGANQSHGAKRPLLHAKSLKIDHPVTGEGLLIEAPLPQDFEDFLKRIQ